MSDEVIYPYRDVDGTLLYEVVRRVVDGKKAFLQRRPDGQGGWAWNLDGVRSVPYRLPELRGHAVVAAVEGEKDADNLWRLGVPATTCSGGANRGRWTDAHSEALRALGAVLVVVFPDNDRPGRRHAARVVNACLRAGLRVVVVALPDLPEKGDVSDWLAVEGNTPQRLLGLVRDAQSVTSPLPEEDDDARRPPARRDRVDADGARALRLLLGFPPGASGNVSVRCPFHDDVTPSLSADLTHGRFFCHGGCAEPKGGSALLFLKKRAAARGVKLSNADARHELVKLLWPTTATKRGDGCPPTSPSTTDPSTSSSPTPPTTPSAAPPPSAPPTPATVPALKRPALLKQPAL